VHNEPLKPNLPVVGIVNSSVMLLSRNHVGYIFSEDYEVVKLLADIIPLIAVFQIGDDLSGATQGKALCYFFFVFVKSWLKWWFCSLPQAF
jgi:hypothetical protein